MTGIYVSVISTCTHCTHRTLYPQLLERKIMDSLYYFGLHTSHTLPTASCEKKYGCYLLFSPAHTAHTAHSTHISPNHPLGQEYMCLLFSPAHIAHTAHSTHSFLKEKIWMLSIFLACTHRTHYPQHLARKNMDATYYFHLHTLHTP